MGRNATVGFDHFSTRQNAKPSKGSLAMGELGM